MIAREEWLGCRHDASPMFDILGSTLVWVQCILFFMGNMMHRLLSYEVFLFIYVHHSFSFLIELWCAHAHLFYTLQVSACSHLQIVVV